MLEWSENLYLELYLGRWINVQVISGIRCGGPSWCGDPPQKPTDWDLTFEGEGDGAAHGGLGGGNRHPQQGRGICLCLWDFHQPYSWTQTHRSHRRMCSHNMNSMAIQNQKCLWGWVYILCHDCQQRHTAFLNVVLFTPNKVLNLHTNNKEVCWDSVRCH